MSKTCKSKRTGAAPGGRSSIAADLPQRLLTRPEAAGILNVSLKTLQRRIDAGELPVVRDGRLVRIHPRDLERYVAARRTL